LEVLLGGIIFFAIMSIVVLTILYFFIFIAAKLGLTALVKFIKKILN
jgi:hypothetical protein